MKIKQQNIKTCLTINTVDISDFQTSYSNRENLLNALNFCLIFVKIFKMTFILNKHNAFYLCTLTFLILCQISWSANIMGHINVRGLKVVNETQLNIRNCQNLCGRCGCVGFYCGEECICECNQGNIDTNEGDATLPAQGCLTEMQIKARILNLPFELLIQGPNANRLVKTAMQMDQHANLNTMERNKRSTVSIYRPEVSDGKREPRHTKNNENMDWFTEFASGLVRPAPRKIKSVEKTMRGDNSKTHEEKERTWFDADDEDDEQIMQKGKPYYKGGPIKRKGEEEWSSKKYQNNRLSDSTDSDNQYAPEVLAQLLYEMPMKMVDSMPAALRDAIKRIRMNSLPAAERKKSTDMRLKYADATQESEEEETYSRNDEIEHLLRGLQQNTFGVFGLPTGKSTADNKDANVQAAMPLLKSPEYWSRLLEVLQQKYGKDKKKN